MPSYDLHCHSTCSDGTLSPREVVARAASRGVDVLALTDHDELGGLSEAAAEAAERGLRFIPGVEISVNWGDVTLHIVGLNIDAGSDVLISGLDSIRGGRVDRARRMAQSLEAIGLAGVEERAFALAGNPNLIGRAHLARALVELGHVKDSKTVFQRYLVPGKPGYVEHEWATLEQAVRWIHGAGGLAVIAHPGRYRVTPPQLQHLIEEFRDLGGDGLEVVTSSHTPEQFALFAQYSTRYGLLASCGSDFHGPGESYMDFGELPSLPAGCVPVWTRL